MNRKLTIIVAGVALLVVSCVAGTMVVLASDGSSAEPVAAAPPDWVQAIVTAEVQRCGNPEVEDVSWVLTNYAAGESVLDQQQGSSSQSEYLIVLTATTEFVNYNGHGPVEAKPAQGKYIALLINADTHSVDTFGIGNDVVKLDGLGQVASYSIK